MTKNELRDWLLNNCVDANGDLNLSDLDFSDFEGDIYINNMKVKGNLKQSFQQVQGSLYQSCQVVGGDLYQYYQEVQGSLNQSCQDIKGEKYE